MLPEINTFGPRQSADLVWHCSLISMSDVLKKGPGSYYRQRDGGAVKGEYCKENQ